jgi:hypothetical protein
MDRVKSVSCFECGVMVCEDVRDVISMSEIRRFLPSEEFAGMCVSFHTRGPRIANQGRVGKRG